jgi:hypothetical protein
LYPNFIGIGAQKSGTTWLSRNLGLHPEIWIPSVKEVHYFDDRIKDPANPLSRFRSKLIGDDTLDRRWRRIAKTQAKRHLRGLSAGEVLWDLKYLFGSPGDGWYASLFDGRKGRVKGEITPAYSMLGPEAVAHVHELMPDAKLIFMMRNPVERAWSQAAGRFNRASERNDREHVRDARLRRHFDSERSRLRTDYLGTLERWGAFYPEEQIFVGFLEDARFFPQELLRSLYSFLGVDPSVEHGDATRKIHSGSWDTIATRFAVYLARAYYEEIRELHERFGGYTSFWLHCAETLIENPPEEEFIPYPFWDSTRWKGWVGKRDGDSKQPRFQSGPLSSVYGS